jgi:hypothetical protein
MYIHFLLHLTTKGCFYDIIDIFCTLTDFLQKIIY